MSIQVGNGCKSNYYAKASKLQKDIHNKPISKEYPKMSEKDSLSAKDSVEDYYKSLREKFSNLNINVGNHEKRQTADSGINNVLISPEYLKKAANDPEIARKLENDISGIPEALNWLKGHLKMAGTNLKAFGIVIDENGNMSSWGCSSRTSESESKFPLTDDKKTNPTKSKGRYKKREAEDDLVYEKYTEKDLVLFKKEQEEYYQQYLSKFPYNTSSDFFDTKA